MSPAVSHPHGNLLTLQCYLLSSVISSGYPVFSCRSHTTVTDSVPPGSDSFFLEVFLSFFSLESGNDNSLTCDSFPKYVTHQEVVLPQTDWTCCLLRTSPWLLPLLGNLLPRYLLGSFPHLFQGFAQMSPLLTTCLSAPLSPSPALFLFPPPNMLCNLLFLFLMLIVRM